MHFVQGAHTPLYTCFCSWAGPFYWFLFVKQKLARARLRTADLLVNTATLTTQLPPPYVLNRNFFRLFILRLFLFSISFFFALFSFFFYHLFFFIGNGFVRFFILLFLNANWKKLFKTLNFFRNWWTFIKLNELFQNRWTFFKFDFFSFRFDELFPYPMNFFSNLMNFFWIQQTFFKFDELSWNLMNFFQILWNLCQNWWASF